MGRFVGVVVYQGLIEDIMVFESATAARAWVDKRRADLGVDETSASTVWDAELRVPV